MTRILLLFTLVVGPATNQLLAQEEWVFLAELAPGDSVFIDMRSLKLPQEGQIGFWTRIEFSQIQTSPSSEPFDVEMTRYQLDCVNSYVRVLAIARYSGERVVASATEPAARWLAAPPGSLASVLVRDVCPTGGGSGSPEGLPGSGPDEKAAPQRAVSSRAGRSSN